MSTPPLPRRRFLQHSAIALAAWPALRASLVGAEPRARAGTRLIVRGDDMGFSHSGNEALIKCFREGIETSIEVLAPSPWFPEAVRLLAENPGVDVGVHLALTSEWDNVKWRPLTPCPSLVDPDGYFFPMLRPNKDYPGRAVSEQPWKMEEVERESSPAAPIGSSIIPDSTRPSCGRSAISDTRMSLSIGRASPMHGRTRE